MSIDAATTGQVVYFGFDRVSGNTVLDDSGDGNDGELTSLATMAKTSGTCGNGLRLQGGEEAVRSVSSVFSYRSAFTFSSVNQ